MPILYVVHSPNFAALKLLIPFKEFDLSVQKYVEKKFKEWSKASPLTFIGFSSINFDEECVRKEFFKSLRDPYLTNTKGNVRHDALNIIRAAYAVDPCLLYTSPSPRDRG